MRLIKVLFFLASLLALKQAQFYVLHEDSTWHVSPGVARGSIFTDYYSPTMRRVDAKRRPVVGKCYNLPSEAKYLSFRKAGTWTKMYGKPHHFQFDAFFSPRNTEM